MKVVFRLNKRQLKMAKAIVSHCATLEARSKEDGWKASGNACVVLDGPYGVSPQRLQLAGDLLEFSGLRSALHKGTGECYALLATIAYPDHPHHTETFEVVSYETTTPNLPWWAEESDDWVIEAASEERLQWLRQNGVGYTRQKAVDELRKRGILPPASPAYKTATDPDFVDVVELDDEHNDKWVDTQQQA